MFCNLVGQGIFVNGNANFISSKYFPFACYSAIFILTDICKNFNQKLALVVSIEQ